MNYNNSKQMDGSSLSAKLSTLESKIEKEFETYCQEIQRDIERQFVEVVQLATEKFGSAETFIQQRVDRIEELKALVKRAYVIRDQRLDDLEFVRGD